MDGQAVEWIYEDILKLPFGYKICRLKKKFFILQDVDRPKWIFMRKWRDPMSYTYEKRIWPKQ